MRKLVMRGHGPQDVTSTWTGREGINLPEEVGPQARRKISSQLPTEGYRRMEIDGRNEHTGARPGPAPDAVAALRGEVTGTAAAPVAGRGGARPGRHRRGSGDGAARGGRHWR